MYFGIYNQVFDTSIAYDIAIYYSNATDSMRMRYHSVAMGIYGTLVRIGYRVRFMNYDDIKAGQYTQVKALVLPRNERMNNGELAYMYNTVAAYGVHIYAETDLPGYQTPYMNYTSDFSTNLKNLFGVQAVQVNAFTDTVYDYSAQLDRTSISVTPTGLTLSTGSTPYSFRVWKYHKISLVSGAGGTILATMAVPNDTTLYPGVVLKTLTKSKAILVTFPLGDVNCTSSCPSMDSIWSAQYKWYKAIFNSATGFNIQPAIITSGSEKVQASYLKIGDSSSSWYAIYVTNWSDKSTETVSVTSSLIVGYTIKDMLNGRVVLQTKSAGVITATLDPLETVIFLSGEPSWPYIYISANSTPTDLFPMLYTVAPNIDYDTLGSTMYITLEVRSSLGIVYGSAQSMVQGNGRVTLQLYLTDASLSAADKLLSSSEGVSYYYIAYLSLSTTCSTIITTTIDNVLVSWPLKPAASLPTSLKVSGPIVTPLQWENHPVDRLKLFRGMVAVFNSTKTGAIDPSHYKKVQGVINQLIAMGYQRSFIVPSDCTLLENGYLYTVISDTNTTQTSGWFLAQYTQVVILPGVTVMSDGETDAMWYLANNDQNSVVVSTEGRVGMYKPDMTVGESRLSSFFGMQNIPADTSPTTVTNLSVNNNNHPSVRTFPKVNATVYNVTTGIAWGVAGWGYPLGSVGANPALIFFSPGPKGASYLFNFDAATSASTKELAQLWSTVVEHAIAGSSMYKIRWELKCGRSSVIIGDDLWCPTGNGTVTSNMITPNICPSTLIPILTGYVYPWWSSVSCFILSTKNLQNSWYDRKGFYTSENDNGYTLTVKLT
jgi:hypothetical protein